MQAPLAEANQQGVQNRQPNGLYVFEHETYYILIHAPYTRTVEFWYISDVPQWFQRVTFVTISPYFEVLRKENIWRKESIRWLLISADGLVMQGIDNIG